MYSMVSYQPATNRIQSLHLTISSMGSKWLHWVWLMTTKTATTATTFVLMPLSRLARVGNFWFNLFFPFLLIVPVLCFNAISFRILLYALFRQFPWSNLFFTSYFKIFNLTNLKFDVSTDDMTITLQTALIIISFVFKTAPTLSWRTSVNSLLISLPTHILIRWCSIPHILNSSATVRSCLTTVQQN